MISIQRMMGDPGNGFREEWHTLTCPLQLPLHYEKENLIYDQRNPENL